MSKLRKGNTDFSELNLRHGETSENLRYAQLEVGLKVGFGQICLSSCKAQEFLIRGKAGVCLHTFAWDTDTHSTVHCVSLYSHQDRALLARKIFIKNRN